MPYFTNPIPESKTFGIPLSTNPRDIISDSVIKSLADVDLSGVLIYSTATAYAHKVDTHFKHLKQEREESQTVLPEELNKSCFRTSFVDLGLVYTDCLVHAASKVQEAVDAMLFLIEDMQTVWDTFNGDSLEQTYANASAAYFDDPNPTTEAAKDAAYNAFYIETENYGLLPSIPTKIEETSLLIPDQEEFLTNLDIEVTSCIYAKPYPTFFVYRDYQETVGLNIFYGYSDKPDPFKDDLIINFDGLEINEEFPNQIRYRLELDVGGLQEWVNIEIPLVDTFHTSYRITSGGHNHYTPVFISEAESPYLTELALSYKAVELDRLFAPRIPLMANKEYLATNVSQESFLSSEEALRLLYVNIYGLSDEFILREESHKNEEVNFPIQHLEFLQGISLEKPSSGGASYLYELFIWLSNNPQINRNSFENYEALLNEPEYYNPFPLENILTIEGNARLEIKYNWFEEEILEGTWQTLEELGELPEGEVENPHSQGTCEVRIVEPDPVIEIQKVNYQQGNFLLSQNTVHPSQVASNSLTFGYHADDIPINKHKLEIYKQVSETQYSKLTVEGFRIITNRNTNNPEQVIGDPQWLVGVNTPSGYTPDPEIEYFRPLLDVTEAVLSKEESLANMIIPMWDYAIKNEESLYYLPQLLANQLHSFKLVEQAYQDSLHLIVYNEFTEEDYTKYLDLFFDVEVPAGNYIYQERAKYFSDVFTKSFDFYIDKKEGDDGYNEADTVRPLFFNNIAVAPNILAYIPIPSKPDNNEDRPAYFQGQKVMGKVLSNQLFMNKYTYDFEVLNPLNNILAGIEFEQKPSLLSREDKEEE